MYILPIDRTLLNEQSFITNLSFRVTLSHSATSHLVWISQRARRMKCCSQSWCNFLLKTNVRSYGAWSPRFWLRACLLPAAGSQLNAFFRLGTRRAERARSHGSHNRLVNNGNTTL